MTQRGQLVIDQHIDESACSGFVKSSLGSVLSELLEGDLDFAQDSDGTGVHNLHAFPAKYPPHCPVFSFST